jgi:serine/threonine-protein kinase HipA
MALNLFGRANKLTRANFIDAGERLGLRPRATVAMIDAPVDAASVWLER